MQCINKIEAQAKKAVTERMELTSRIRVDSKIDALTDVLKEIDTEGYTTIGEVINAIKLDIRILNRIKQDRK